MDTNRIKLGSPTLRDAEQPFVEFDYAVADRRYLPVPSRGSSAGVFDVLGRRSSRRVFEALSDAQLAALLWHSARVISSRLEPGGYRWQHRPAPSGGGRHPIDILITNRPESNDLYLYDPVAHSLCTLALSDASQLLDLKVALNHLLQTDQATAILFAAQFGRTCSKYHDGESIIWRDSGALGTTMGLAAEALGLNFCMVGITGEPWLSRSLGTDRVIGVGGCLVGAPAGRLTDSREALLDLDA